MKTAIDARLLDEAGRFHLRFACDDCVHFAPERDRDARDGDGEAIPVRGCGNAWPDGLRRSALHPPCDGTTLAFCKEFELG